MSAELTSREDSFKTGDFFKPMPFRGAAEFRLETSH
jgi:hypothetical protein